MVLKVSKLHTDRNAIHYYLSKNGTGAIILLSPTVQEFGGPLVAFLPKIPHSANKYPHLGPKRDRGWWEIRRC